MKINKHVLKVFGVVMFKYWIIFSSLLKFQFVLTSEMTTRWRFSATSIRNYNNKPLYWLTEEDMFLLSVTAVGHLYLCTFRWKCGERLTQHGRACCSWGLNPRASGCKAVVCVFVNLRTTCVDVTSAVRSFAYSVVRHILSFFRADHGSELAYDPQQQGFIVLNPSRVHSAVSDGAGSSGSDGYLLYWQK